MERESVTGVCAVVAFYEWLIVFAAAAAALHLDFGWRERERGSQGIY
jgi:hypothetical protein